MSARDPQTGQFVSGTGGPAAGYENLEIQFVKNGATWQADAISAEATVEQWASFEPLGGLQRGEFAELVGIIGRETLYHVAIGGNDIPGSMRVEYDLSMDPEIYGGHPQEVEQDFDGITGLDIAELVAVDPDILRHNVHTVVNEFGQYSAADSAGSGGGGTTTDATEVVYSYRDVLGAGPVLDRHDTLYQHLAYNLSGDTNSRYTFHTDYLLYWNVFEE